MGPSVPGSSGLWVLDALFSCQLRPPRPLCQCVAGAMYITGFAESVSDLLSFRSIWVVRGMSVVVLLALLGINLAGVKWIIRLQLLLLFLLAVSTLDFVVGSFTHLDPGKPSGFRRGPSRNLHCFLVGVSLQGSPPSVTYSECTLPGAGEWPGCRGRKAPPHTGIFT